MVEKSPEAYRTIGEASKEVGEPSYVLRFWETKFKQIKLIKRPGGRRFYRPEDISLLLKIKNFLRNDGLSIKDVNSKLNDSKASSLSPINNLDKKKSSIATELNINSSEKSNKGELLKKLNEILETLS
ncbi:MerR family transcriptional regulator [Hyphomicrobiales bacterium]|jgi:DNA-binding transcriptional MerR regulator|nr:MerR family transcriptional regulator [Hyphomicrobiales bacterium]|tara:strand:+ start:2274 stop:2657 length:384 start_codon:yes stop_codon:yes gene_type:complete